MTTNMKLFSLLFILIAPSWASAEYSDERFSIKGAPIWVNLIDDAKDGCWTNIGEVRRYTEDKLAENGALIRKNPENAAMVLNFRVLARRWQVAGWCYGSMTLSLNVEAFVPNTDFRVNGSIYRKQSIDIEPQNFNITILDWLSKKFKELN